MDVKRNTFIREKLGYIYDQIMEKAKTEVMDVVKVDLEEVYNSKPAASVCIK